MFFNVILIFTCFLSSVSFANPPSIPGKVLYDVRKEWDRVQFARNNLSGIAWRNERSADGSWTSTQFIVFKKDGTIWVEKQYELPRSAINGFSTVLSGGIRSAILSASFDRVFFNDDLLVSLGSQVTATTLHTRHCDPFCPIWGASSDLRYLILGLRDQKSRHDRAAVFSTDENRIVFRTTDIPGVDPYSYVVSQFPETDQPNPYFVTYLLGSGLGEQVRVYRLTDFSLAFQKTSTPKSNFVLDGDQFYYVTPSDSGSQLVAANLRTGSVRLDDVSALREMDTVPEVKISLGGCSVAKNDSETILFKLFDPEPKYKISESDWRLTSSSESCEHAIFSRTEVWEGKPRTEILRSMSDGKELLNYDSESFDMLSPSWLQFSSEGDLWLRFKEEGSKAIRAAVIPLK